MNPKPYDNCGMCQKLGDECYCSCHKMDIMEGYHENIFRRPD